MYSWPSDMRIIKPSLNSFAIVNFLALANFFKAV
jgi:hypothetical protein